MWQQFQKCNFLTLYIEIVSISWEISPMWMPQNLSDDNQQWFK